MKKIVLIASMLIALSTQAHAEKVLHFEWIYPEISDLKGFKIFQTDKVEPLVVLTDPQVRSHEMPLPGLSDGKTCFNMLAFDATQESARSEEYCVDPVPDIPGGLKVTVTVILTVGG